MANQGEDGEVDRLGMPGEAPRVLALRQRLFGVRLAAASREIRSVAPSSWYTEER
jgi:hypothetical protein